MENVAKTLKKTIQIQEKKFKNDEVLKKFEDSSKEFENLVKAGLVKKRGYNIMSLEESFKNAMTFNSNYR